MGEGVCQKWMPAPTPPPTPAPTPPPTPAPTPSLAFYCLKITTSSGGGGTLDVRVNAGSGLVQEATGLNAHGATVLDKCYTTEVSILELQNPTTDGWAGSVEYSTNGGAAYTFLTCTNCGVGSSSEFIIVDGNANGAGFAPTECLNGDACSFVQAPTPSPTPAPTPPPTLAPTPPSPAPPSTPLLCSSWCAANTQPFSVKVTWTSCKGCTDPSASTPTSTPAPPPTPAPPLMCSSWCAAR